MEHKDLIKVVSQQLKTILLESGQGIYIYLDDIHKICNKKFSSLLGYDSPEEWSQVTDSFPDAFVAKDSQQALVETYQNAMQRKVGAQVEIIWKRKEGGEVPTKVILVPIEYNGHLVALHFISPK